MAAERGEVEYLIGRVQHVEAARIGRVGAVDRPVRLPDESGIPGRSDIFVWVGAKL